MWILLQNVTYQVWYDDPLSLAMKYKLALDNDLRGVGMWNADAVNLAKDTLGTMLMWGALPDYYRIEHVKETNNV